MRYVSTRGKSPALSFSEVVLEGLARDGGLYLPESIPQFHDRLSELAHLRYQDLALELFLPFMEPDFTAAEIAGLIEESYHSFDHLAVTPLVQAGQHWLLELWHGPTYAFKDLALQFLGNLFESLLQKKGGELNIVGATSGDTGSAAIYGVKGKKGIRIFILHPKGKVSPIQERQMTSVLDDNVFNIAVDGSFDQAQSIVKELFGDLEFKDQYSLGAVNSINWARVMAQIVYYFYAFFRWKEKTGINEAIFSVPTGNFGDIYAGTLAKRMGLPIKRLLLGTNENDILFRTFDHGDYSVAPVVETISPSMDIQLASNFERYLYDLCSQEPDQVNSWMLQVKQGGKLQWDQSVLAKANQDILGFRVDQQQALDVMSRYYHLGIELDPHSAVAVGAAEQSGFKDVICLSTAHPAKFADAFKQATGQDPKTPAALAALEKAETKVSEAAADKKVIQDLMIAQIQSGA